MQLDIHVRGVIAYLQIVTVGHSSSRVLSLRLTPCNVDYSSIAAKERRKSVVPRPLRRAYGPSPRTRTPYPRLAPPGNVSPRTPWANVRPRAIRPPSGSRGLTPGVFEALSSLLIPFPRDSAASTTGTLTLFSSANGSSNTPLTIMAAATSQADLRTLAMLQIATDRCVLHSFTRTCYSTMRGRWLVGL